MSQALSTDRKWMRRAIALARQSVGSTRPNPPVGAVVVRDGCKLGEGRHCYAGGEHAEVAALRNCQTPVTGGTIYVTLEPCSTWGHQPPCTTAILAAGITRVVIGCLDPSSKHNGRGVELLTSQGVAVTSGVCQPECEQLIQPFAKHIATGLPYLTLKLAMTLDGKIADRQHHSKWITGTKARYLVQKMRKQVDAVMVGAGTVCADNPSLLCQLRGKHKTLRIIVDAEGKTQPDARVYTDKEAHRTIVATTVAGMTTRGDAWQAGGARLWVFEPDARGLISPQELLQRAGSEGLLHVLCEGGSQLAGVLHDSGMIDEYALFYAPMISGDIAALTGIGGQGDLLADMLRLQFDSVGQVGDDILIRAKRR